MELSVVIFILALVLMALMTLIFIGFSKKSIEIKDGAISLEEVLPVQHIEQDLIINGSGDITAGFKVFLPEVFTMPPEEAVKLFNDFDGIFKMLTPGTVIHQQNFYFEDEYMNPGIGAEQNYIQKENLIYYQGKPILLSYTNIYITFTANNTITKSYATSCLLRKLNYPFKQPYKDFEKRLPEIESQLINFENGMKGLSGFKIIRMDDQALNNSLFDFINCSYHKPVADATVLAVDPMSISDQGDFKIGNQFVSILSLVEEGGQIYPLQKSPKTVPATSFGNGISIPENIKSKCSMVYPIGLGLPINHILNVTIEITDTDTTISKLNSIGSGLNFLSIFYPPAKAKQLQLKNFCDEIGAKSYTTTYTSVNLILNDTDRYRLQRKISLAANAFMNMNHSKCYIENFETANLFFSSIPGNSRANYRGFINTSVQGLCYLNKEGLYLSDTTGYIFLDRFGKPVVVDLWNTPLITNRNAIVIGPSGSGKSYWINLFILESIVLGFDNIIIDIGGSYKSMILLNRGKYFDSGNPKEFSFNPFLCKKNKEGRYIYMNDDPDDPESSEDSINYIATIIAKIWKNSESIRQVEWALLKKSIIRFFDYINNNNISPNLIEYGKFISSEAFQQDNYEKTNFDVRDLAELLEPYTIGRYSFLLNADSNFDIVNDTLICFDMESASKAEYFPIVTIIVLNLAAEKIKQRRGVRKRLIIDEAFDFLMDPKMGDFIGYLYRTFRKKEGGIMLAAQNVNFINQIPEAIRESVTINCDIKIVLDHRKYRQTYPAIKSTLSFTDNEIQMLDSIQTGDGWRQFLIKVGSKTFIFSTDVCETADAAFDSRQPVVMEIQRLFEETGSLPAALNQYLENKRINHISN